jgi:hypothetical protein
VEQNLWGSLYTAMGPSERPSHKNGHLPLCLCLSCAVTFGQTLLYYCIHDLDFWMLYSTCGLLDLRQFLPHLNLHLVSYVYPLCPWYAPCLLLAFACLAFMALYITVMYMPMACTLYLFYVVIYVLIYYYITFLTTLCMLAFYVYMLYVPTSLFLSSFVLDFLLLCNLYAVYVATVLCGLVLPWPHACMDI